MSFFRDLFLRTARIFYNRFPVKTWRGLRLICFDGTGLRLPDESWLGKAFGWHENQHGRVPSVRWLICFDLLNQILLDVRLHPRHQGELTITAPLIPYLDKDVLAIYDRGFNSYLVPYLHQLYGTHCLMRLKTDFSPLVVDFLNSGEKERLVECALTDRSVRALRQNGISASKKDVVKFRLIRVELPKGQVEVLLTNLFHRQHFHHKHFAALYQKRWGVETSIFVLKSFFQAATFSSYSTHGVAQDIWALFAMYNLQSMLFAAQQKQLQQLCGKRLYLYRINRNVGIGIIKRFSTSIFLEEIKAWQARIHCRPDELIRRFEPVRPQPGRERKRKILRGTERHIYESNYKQTL